MIDKFVDERESGLVMMNERDEKAIRKMMVNIREILYMNLL